MAISTNFQKFPPNLSFWRFRVRRIYRNPETMDNLFSQKSSQEENKIMKYLVLMYANESEAPQTQEELQALQPAWFAYMQEAQAAGVLLSNGGVAPGANATTVRVRNGKPLITDGPFAETHEQ